MFGFKRDSDDDVKRAVRRYRLSNAKHELIPSAAGLGFIFVGVYVLGHLQPGSMDPLLPGLVFLFGAFCVGYCVDRFLYWREEERRRKEKHVDGPKG